MLENTANIWHDVAIVMGIWIICLAIHWDINLWPLNGLISLFEGLVRWLFWSMWNVHQLYFLLLFAWTSTLWGFIFHWSWLLNWFYLLFGLGSRYLWLNFRRSFESFGFDRLFLGFKLFLFMVHWNLLVIQTNLNWRLVFRSSLNVFFLLHFLILYRGFLVFFRLALFFGRRGNLGILFFSSLLNFLHRFVDFRHNNRRNLHWVFFMAALCTYFTFVLNSLLLIDSQTLILNLFDLFLCGLMLFLMRNLRFFVGIWFCLFFTFSFNDLVIGFFIFLWWFFTWSIVLGLVSNTFFDLNLLFSAWLLFLQLIKIHNFNWNLGILSKFLLRLWFLLLNFSDILSVFLLFTLQLLSGMMFSILQ